MPGGENHQAKIGWLNFVTFSKEIKRLRGRPVAFFKFNGFLFFVHIRRGYGEVYQREHGKNDGLNKSHQEFEKHEG